LEGRKWVSSTPQDRLRCVQESGAALLSGRLLYHVIDLELQKAPYSSETTQMQKLLRRALNISVGLSLMLIFCSGLRFAQAAAPVSITSPAANSSVSATVAFTCSNAASGATVNLYIDNVYVAGGIRHFRICGTLPQSRTELIIWSATAM